MNEMRELTINELDAVSGGEKVNCTVTKAVTVFGWTFAEAKCENGMTIKVIQPPA
jgi:bacteriocin-like protein